MIIWNPWHGCHKKSSGCLNCYMFRRDSLYEKDSNIISKTKEYNLPLKKHRDGTYYIKSGEIVYTCMTSDFFLEEADSWRKEIYQIIKERKDLTCENQKMADERCQILLELPLKHREIICEPLLEEIKLDKYLQTGCIEKVTCGGESGDKARVCNYDWVLKIRTSCQKYHTNFYFKQTGANFIKDNKLYKIARINQLKQANKANIDLQYNN